MTWRDAILLGLALFGVNGCGKSTNDLNAEKSPFIEVVYEGKPLADVQIRLHETRDGSIRASAMSDDLGKAYFPDLPLPEPEEYFVSAEAVGDGGWSLDPKLADPKLSLLKVKALSAAPAQRIVLPAKAVHLLSPQR